MAEINRLKSSKLKTTKSSSQESACLLILRLPAASIPFHKICCFEAEEATTASAFAFRLGPPSLTGQPNREGSADMAWEVMESMHLCVIPKFSARGMTRSQNLRALSDFLKLFSND
ncbi:hypothetical protein FF2_006105 [Malus domestica]